jgi:hypothetical protein
MGLIRLRHYLEVGGWRTIPRNQHCWNKLQIMREPCDLVLFDFATDSGRADATRTKIQK